MERLHGTRAPLQHQSRVQHEWTRAEDFYREQHHDEHAIVLNPNPAVAAPRNTPSSSPDSGVIPPVRSPDRRMRILVVKALPAPLMDGFDVSAFRVNQVYTVDGRIGSYLVIAGYAVPDGDTPPNASDDTTT
jgi:hypothetical protein